MKSARIVREPLGAEKVRANDKDDVAAYWHLAGMTTADEVI